MDPINKKERDSLFWQFVVMFAAAVALFLMVLHFDFRLPTRISDMQRKKLAEYEAFATRQTRIAESIEKMESMIMVMTDGKDITGPNERVSQELSRFKSEFSGSDTSNPTYRLIISMYNAMDKHRAAQASAASTSDRFSDLKEERDRIRDELARAKNDLTACQMMH